MIDDQTLIARVVMANDHYAFTTLVTKHQQAIRQFLRRLTAGDHALADDIAQEVFTTAYRKLAGYRAEATFSTWLHSIAYRSFLNEKRKLHHTNEVQSEAEPEFVARCSNIDSDIQLERLMQLLNVTERTCITLAYSAGMSHAEIVQVTKIPLGSVKSYINRGMKKLEQWVQLSEQRSTE